LPKKTAAQALVEQLIANDVENVFCLPGESYLSVLDACDDRGLRLTVCWNEAGGESCAGGAEIVR